MVNEVVYQFFHQNLLLLIFCMIEKILIENFDSLPVSMFSMLYFLFVGLRKPMPRNRANLLKTFQSSTAKWKILFLSPKEELLCVERFGINTTNYSNNQRVAQYLLPVPDDINHLISDCIVHEIFFHSKKMYVFYFDISEYITYNTSWFKK